MVFLYSVTNFSAFPFAAIRFIDRIPENQMLQILLQIYDGYYGDF